jgi:hypothetical protein
MLSWMLRLRWRLHIDVRIRVEVHAVDEQAARIAVQTALHHRDTVIGLSRADVDAVPTWRPLGTASRVGLYTDIIVVSNGPGAWRCVARMLATFTVDATDAAWPNPLLRRRHRPRLRRGAGAPCRGGRPPYRAPLPHPQPLLSIGRGRRAQPAGQHQNPPVREPNRAGPYPTDGRRSGSRAARITQQPRSGPVSAGSTDQGRCWVAGLR